MPPLYGIVSSDLDLDDEITLYSPIFDSYDHWTEVDNRLQAFAEEVFLFPDSIAHDVLHMSIYAHYISVSVDTIRRDETAAQELADLQAFVESFLTSSRSACDAIAAFISRTCIEKKGQAPESLRALSRWIRKHPDRVTNQAIKQLLSDLEWFEELRRIRDAIVHFGGHPWIITNGEDFRLIVHAPYKQAAISDVDLIALLRMITTSLLRFMDQSGEVINAAIGLPADRERSRRLLGMRLKDLMALR